MILRDLKIFNQMLIADQFRGVHSTGVASVAKGQAEVYKRALNAMDFLQLKKSDELITVTADTLIGHNRYATKGGVSDSTAHPFQHGEITLVHNGTLTSTNSLPEGNKFTVDSEAICYAMSIWEPQQVLEELQGAYALVWHDARDNTLNFARNDERELCIAQAGQNVYWASERKMLEWILDRNNITTADYCDLVKGKHVTLNLADKITGMESLKYTDFTPKQVSYSRYYQGGYHQQGGHQTKKIGSDAEKRLAYLGYTEGEEIEFFLTDFISYKHDVTKGNAVGFDITNNQPVIILNSSKSSVVMGTQGQPSMEVIYCGEVSRAARMHYAAVASKHDGDWIEIKRESLQWEELDGKSADAEEHNRLYGLEVVEEKKPSTSSTDEEYTDTWVDGVLFKAAEVPDLLNSGCAMCGNPFGIVSLQHAKLTDQGEPIHGHVCWQEYQKLMAAET